VLIEPYYYIAAVVIILMVVIYLNHLPRFDMPDSHKRFTTILSELLQKKNYREGVLAEFFYVGAQSACWMYIILYGTRIFVAEGLTEQEAEVMSQKYNIVAIAFFACSRFICSWLMNWFSPARMLSTMGIIGIAALIGVIFFTDRNGIYCLVAVSICLSLMFPTIYGLALQGIGENIKIAGAGLIMAILGGSFFPPIQAAIIQSDITVLGLPSTNLSFLIPLLCLAMIVWYAHRAYVRHSIQGTAE
jgi:FHS family L-fucose permease-like MFS transporter